MTRKSFFGILLSLLLAVQVVPAPARAAAAPSYTLTAEPSSPGAGGEVKLVLQGRDLADVYAFDVTLSYDAAKLRFKKAESGIAGMSTDPILGEGEVRFAHTKVGQTAGVSGSAALATFVFEAAGAGETGVAVKELKLVDSKLNLTALHPDAKAALRIGAAVRFADLGAKWSWAADAIGYLAGKGIVGGTGGGKYEPALPVKRGDLMLMLVRAFGLQAPAGADASAGNFPDVPKSKYYADAIAAAKALGIAAGDGAGFKPEAPVTRQDLMVLFERTLQTLGRTLPKPDGTELNGFADKDRVAGYAKASVAALVKAGVVKGGAAGIEPLKATNRAETAVFLYRLLTLR
ncbi:S-layer homology domain-containing protein [Paenibacillus sp. MWE-103]|uniref:S-layer homology domain-containing protein n=1 Tax=Paenibacillus artemisiicola TaxID=1172618 RepID=A0ABS3WF58_9BACL|nr:cohesin domain-containing protein [Paenibacillus artemisiicola]MBO7746947.1 S-layer homology domain-containing protein [Paenibacillus artemisiicola]